MSSFPRGHSLTNPARPAALPRPPLLPSLCSTLGTVQDVTCSPPHILPCVFTPASTDRLTMRALLDRTSLSLYPVPHRARHVVVPVMCQHALPYLEQPTGTDGSRPVTRARHSCSFRREALVAQRASEQATRGCESVGAYLLLTLEEVVTERYEYSLCFALHASP